MQLGHTGQGWPRGALLKGGHLIIKPPLADGIEGEGEKLESSASVELVLELNPAWEERGRAHEKGNSLLWLSNKLSAITDYPKRSFKGKIWD